MYLVETKDLIRQQVLCSSYCWYTLKDIKNLLNLSAKNLSKDHLHFLERSI